jgi:hypothetical protein
MSSAKPRLYGGLGIVVFLAAIAAVAWRPSGASSLPSSTPPAPATLRALAGKPRGVPASPSLTTSPVAMPSPSPSVTRYVPELIGLQPTPVVFKVPINPAEFLPDHPSEAAIDTLLSLVGQDLRIGDPSGQRAGFVLVYAYGPSSSDAGPAYEEAQHVQAILTQRDSAVFGKAAGDAGWHDSGAPIELEVFFFNPIS